MRSAQKHTHKHNSDVNCHTTTNRVRIAVGVGFGALSPFGLERIFKLSCRNNTPQHTTTQNNNTQQNNNTHNTQQHTMTQHTQQHNNTQHHHNITTSRLSRGKGQEKGVRKSFGLARRGWKKHWRRLWFGLADRQ
jgi:hypothetical protein